MTTIEKVLEAQRTWQEIPVDNEAAMKLIALESLSKCADALAVLGGNLKSFGYPWVSFEPFPAQELRRNIQTIETNTGLAIPGILAAFWERVGGISFLDLDNYRHVGFWQKQGVIPPNGFADGLHIDACSKGWANSICSDFIDWQEYFTRGDAEHFLFSLAPDGYHKDNISGGSPYGLYAGSSWKPVWQNFEWSGRTRPVTAPEDPPDFLSYLRTTILECAGFPALLGDPAFTPIKDRLLMNVPLF